MKNYTVAYVSGTPDWSQIPVLEVNEKLWLPTEGISMTAQVCYNEGGFYVHLKAVEANIRAELSEPLSEVCLDSCMEWFFCPQEGDDRYVNFEMNPIANTYIGVGCGREDRVRLCPGDEDALFQKKANRTEDGWEVFYTVPTAFLRVFYPNFAPKSGAVVRANFYKCGELTVASHFLSWNRVETPRPDFHCSRYFGNLILE